MRMFKGEVVQSSVKSSQTKEEIKLEAVFASSPDGITVTDQNVNITECNQATLDMFGYSSKDEVIGKNALEFIAKKDHQRAMENLKKTIEQGSMANVEYTFLAKDGHEFPAELSASVINATSGRPTGFVAIVRDIIEHKKADDKLKESEEKYRTQFEEALDAIFAADAETGIIIDCNREATKLVGREKSEIVGNHQRILHPPKVIKGKFSRTFKQHRKEKEGQVLETQVITKNGEIKDVAIKANVFKLGGKRILQGIFRDITEQKKDEKALQEAEERYRKTIVNANVGIITYGPEGEVKVLNPKMEEITGFKRTEIPTLVNWFEKLYPNEEERRKVRDKWFKRMSEEGEVKEGHAIITTKEGKRRNFLFNAVQLESGDSIAFAHDITERKLADKALRESEENFRSLINSMDDLVFVLDLDGTFKNYHQPSRKGDLY